jgi:hypothetical protein
MSTVTAPRVRVARGPRRTYLDAAPVERGSGNLRSLVNLAAGGVRLASSSTRPDNAGGEWDFWNAFSTRDRRALGSMGFTSRDGVAPDCFAELLVDSGATPSGMTDVGELCSWWLRSALSAQSETLGESLEAREARHYAELEAEQACTVPPAGAELPQWVTDWLGTLIYEPKRAYAEAYCRSVYCGGIAPERLEHPWVAKVESKVARRLAASLAKGVQS